MNRNKFGTYMFFFLSYALVLLVTISSLIVYYSQSYKHLFQESQEQRISLLSQLESNIDDKYRYSDALMNGMISNTDLLQVAKGYSDSYTDLMGDMHTIYKPDYLLDFSIYIDKTDEVVNDGVHMDAEDFFTYMYHVCGIPYGSFRNQYLLSQKTRALMPIVNIKTYENDPTPIMPYVQSFPVDSGQKKLGQIVVLLDASDTRDLIARLAASTHSDVYVVDKEGNTVLSSAKAPKLSSGLLKKAQNENDFQTRINGRSQMLTQLTSSENSWKYIMTTPYEVCFWENKDFTINGLIIFAVYLILGFIIAHFLTKRSCRPIKEIDEVIRSNMPLAGNSAKNEFSLIKNTLIQQFDDGRKLHEIILDQQPVVRNAYLMSIVKGLDTNYEKAYEKLPSLGVDLKSGRYVIVAFSFNTDSPLFMESDRIEDENIAVARALLRDNGAELLEGDRSSFLLDIDRNQFALLLCLDESAGGQHGIAQLQKRLNKINQTMSAQYKLSLNFGIGLIHKGLESLPKCFDEAKKSLQFGRKNDVSEAVYFENIEDKNADYYFPTETEYLLVNNLKAGNYRAGRELLRNIFAINQNMSVSREGIDAFLNTLSTVMARAVNYPTAAGEKPPPDCPRSRLDPDISLETAQAIFLDYIGYVESASSEKKVISKTEVLVNKIAEFVKENAESKLLDLNYVSRHFHVTPQYISNIFKKYRQEHIKDYISKCKLEKAKVYLKDTDWPLRNISIQMGYADEMGIFRLFRKYEHMTPGEFRANSRG